jgi:sucrose-phosphate synthase
VPSHVLPELDETADCPSHGIKVTSTKVSTEYWIVRTVAFPAATRLIVPSPIDNLRYLFVRWGLAVGNMYLIVGEHGDTDREEMLSGLHKTVIVKGVTEKGSEGLLRSSGSYHREDVVPSESPLAATTRGDPKADEIMRALKEVTKASSGM